MGADTARLTQVMTTGSRIPAILKSTSIMSKNPWDVVAVYVLAPVALAPRTTDAAECSLSTLTYSDLSSPSATNSERCSTIWVCGVIGYAEITCGLQTPTVFATATEPSINVVLITSPPLSFRCHLKSIPRHKFHSLYNKYSRPCISFFLSW